MQLVEQFISFLKEQKNQPSKATIKNYKADINQFIRWLEERFKNSFDPNKATSQVVDLYKESQSFSASSMERHLSSLRKFFNFLKLEGLISQSPFEMENGKWKMENADPYRLKDFKDFLYVYNASHLTIKNYIIDIKQFFKWAQEVSGIENAWDIKEKNLLAKIDSSFIEEYKNRLLEQEFLPSTVNRKLSSLRKYFNWAQAEGLVSGIKYQVLSIKKDEDRGLNDTEALSKLSQKYIPNTKYIIHNTSYSPLPPIRLIQKFFNVFEFVFDYLVIFPLAKLGETFEHVFWQIQGKPIFQNQKSKIKNQKYNEKLKIGNLSKAMYAPLSISTKSFPWHKKAWHHLRHTRPKWYKTYHSYQITHYFHLAILIIFMTAVGFAMYNAFSQSPRTQSPAFAAPVAPPRILSFQGRLTDSSDNPVTTAATAMRMAIYNDPTASGAALLWQEIVSVSPDTDGIFSILLGNNTAITQSIFAQNATLYLGVTVGSTAELTPRQQLATVAFATNAEVLQGLPPVTDAGVTTNTNAVLALNSSGTVSIAGTATTTFQAASGQLTITGKPLLLQTNSGTGGNITLAPDGLGTIDFQKPIQNSTNNNNISTAVGALEVNDLLAVLATSSGQSALTINQTSTGPLISASTSGTAKFTVDNSGNGYFAGNVGIGITTPAQKLDVNGSATFNDNNILHAAMISGGTTVGTRVDMSSGILQLFSAASRTIMLNPSNGNVEINHQLVVMANPTGNTSPVNDIALGAYTGDIDKILGIERKSAANTAGLNFTITSGGATIGATDKNGGNLYLTSGVSTGTGNSNIYLQTFPSGSTGTADNTATTRLTILGSGNVGIGTTAPGAALDVRGLSGTLPAATVSATSSFASLIVDNAGVGDLFTASKSGATKFVITNAGNVGIGTNLPAATLDVVGTLKVSSTTNFGGIAYTWPGSQTTNYVLQTNGSGTLSWVDANAAAASTIYWNQASGLLYPKNSTVDLTIGGQSTASAKFAFINVNSGNPTASISGNLSLAVPTTAGANTFNLLNNSTLNFQRSPGGDAGLAANSVLYLGSNGNVGIGTTTPTARLDVDGAAQTVTAVTQRAIINNTNAITTNTGATDVYGLTIDEPNITVGTVTPTNSSSLYISGAATEATNNYALWVDAGDVRFDANIRFASKGYIDANSDGFWAFINQNYSSQTMRNSDIFGYGLWGFTHTDTGAEGTIAQGSDFLIYKPTIAAQNTITVTDATTVKIEGAPVAGTNVTITNPWALWIDAGNARFDGNVGIGNTTPLTALDVTGSASLSANLSLRGAGTAHTFNILGNGTLNFQRSPGGDAGVSSVLFLQNNGNVGIGTTGPTAKLTVGTAFGGSMTAFGTTFVTNSGALGTTSGNSLTLANIGFTSGNNTALGIRAYRTADGSDWTTSSIVLGMDIDNTSNNKYLAINQTGIGIGTTTPSYALDVTGQVNATSGYLWGTAQNTLGTDQGGSFELGGTGSVANPVASGAPYIDFHFGTGSAQDYNFRLQNAANNRFDFIPSTGTPALSINSASVGIGTTNPLATLDLRGNLGTGPIASFSGRTSFAGLVVDNGTLTTDLGDLITASSSAYPGQTPSGGGDKRTQFRVTNQGTIYARSFYDIDNSAYFLDPAASNGTALSLAGNISIGTTAPGATVDVQSSGGVFGINLKDMLRLVNNDTAAANNGMNIEFSALRTGGQITPAASISALMTNIGSTTYTGALAFSTAGTAAIPTERMRIDGSGNVGIGTTSPTSLLHLAGNRSATAWGTAGIQLQGAAATYTDTSSSGTVANAVVASLAQPTLAASSATTYTDSATLYIANAPTNGTNVTLTNPWALWVDSGKSRFDGDVNLQNNDVVNVSDVRGNNNNVYINFGDGGGYLDLYSTSRPIRLFPGNSQQTVQIGNVGSKLIVGNTVNDADPVNDIAVNGNQARAIGVERHTTSNTAGVNLTVRSGGATSGATDKNGGDLYLASGISTGTGNSNIYLQTFPAGSTGTSDNTATTRLTILGSGNVGIGNTTPLTALDVTGSASLSANLSLRGAGTAHTFNILDNGTLNFQRSPSGDAGLAANSVLYLGSNGNVGMGTTNPSTALQVYRVNSGGAGPILSLASDGGAATTTAINFSPWLTRSGGASVAIVGQDDGNFSGNLLFQTAPTGAEANTLATRMIINSSGNVGIGTTSPLARFDVRGDNGTTPAASVSAQTSFAALITDNSGVGDLFTASKSGATKFVVTNAGNVGIGTNLPTATLDVNGTIEGRLQHLIKNFTTGAGSAVSAGDVLGMNSDGTVGKGIFANQNIGNTTSVAKLDSTHYVIAYTANSRSYAVVCSVSGTTATCGQPVAWSTTTAYAYFYTAVLDSTHFVVVYANGGAAGSAIVGATDGAVTISSYGSASNFGTSVTSLSVAALDSTHFVVAYNDSSTGYGIIGATSGTTISSYGTASQFDATNIQNVSVAALDSTHFVVAYADGSNTGYGIIGATSGTTISSYGTKNSYAALSIGTSIAVLDSTHFVVVYRKNTPTAYNGIVGLTDGATAISSYGAANTFSTSSTQFQNAVSALDSTHFVVSYSDSASTQDGTAIVGVTSGTTISSYGSANVYDTGTTNGNAVAALDSTHFAVGYNPSDGGQGTTIVGATSGTTISSYGSSVAFVPNRPYWVGIANAAASANSTVPVITAGVSTVQSGLTTNSKYYSTPEGNLTTTSTNNYEVGLAISSTSLLINTAATANASQFFGDMIFANNFRITEAQSPTQGLLFYNQNNQQILSLNEKGDLAVTGTITDGQVSNLGDFVFSNEIATPSANTVGPFVLKDPFGNVINKVGAFAEIAVANLRAGFINAQEITTNSLAVTADSVTIGGKNIRDYIVNVVNESISNGAIQQFSNGTISPIASIDSLKTNFISPLASDSAIALSLDSSKFIVHSSNDASSSAVAVIDNQGNATFSGELQTNKLTTSQLTTDNATVGGTLRAKKIIADQIEGLNIQTSTLSAQYITNNYYDNFGLIADSASSSAEEQFNNLAMEQFINISSFSGQLAYVENLNAAFATFTQGVISLGPSSFTDLSVINQLSIGGNLILADASINVLGSDLKLQPLKQGGLSIMGGLVYIDTFGNIKVGGNAEFAKDVTIQGKLSANIISPIPGSDFVIQNSSDSALFTINSVGTATFSGQLNANQLIANKLSFGLVQPALAISNTELLATGSAGVATISAHQTEVTIKNNFVTDKSLIYITPVGQPSTNTPYLIRQVPSGPALSGVEGSFTAGIQSETNVGVPFNWLIIN